MHADEKYYPINLHEKDIENYFRRNKIRETYIILQQSRRN